MTTARGVGCLILTRTEAFFAGLARLRNSQVAMCKHRKDCTGTVTMATIGIGQIGSQVKWRVANGLAGAVAAARALLTVHYVKTRLSHSLAGLRQ